MHICPAESACSAQQAWECSQLNDWVDVNGESPWGDDRNGRIRYLLSMTSGETVKLAEIAFESIDTGCWQGVVTKNGGWEDGGAYDDRERGWRATARDFLERYASGDHTLTEGMLHHADYDLAQELANLRGWCPRRGRV